MMKVEVANQDYDKELILSRAHLPIAPLHIDRSQESYHDLIEKLNATKEHTPKLSKENYDENWSIRPNRSDPIIQQNSMELNEKFNAQISSTFFLQTNTILNYLRALQVERLRDNGVVAKDGESTGLALQDRQELPKEHAEHMFNHDDDFLSYANASEYYFTRSLYMLTVSAQVLKQRFGNSHLTKNDHIMLYETAKWAERSIYRNTIEGKRGYHVLAKAILLRLGSQCELSRNEENDLELISTPIDNIFDTIKDAIYERRAALDIQGPISFERGHRGQLYTDLQRSLIAHCDFPSARALQADIHYQVRRAIRSLSQIKAKHLMNPGTELNGYDNAKIKATLRNFEISINELPKASLLAIPEIDEKVCAIKGYLLSHTAKTKEFISRLQ